MGVVASCVLALATFKFLLWLLPAQTNADLVSIVYVGLSTNAVGQSCLRYRLRNDNAQLILALAEFPNGSPGVFVRLTNSQPQIVDLPRFPTAMPQRMQVSCFVEDRGLLTHAYWAVQRLRAQPIHGITKLLFTVPGPVVEP
jgi:hypothetical protein